MFAYLALHIFDYEMEFVRSRKLFLVRNFSTSRRAWGRRILKQLPKNEFAEGVVLGNFLSDDRCCQCKKPGLLQWCSGCVKAFHSSCGLSGSSKNGDEWTCSRCVTKKRRERKNHGKVPKDVWKKRDEAWRSKIWPRLTYDLDTSKKRRKLNN